MDPDEAWRIVLNEAADTDRRADAACGLVRWVATGGFPPRGEAVATVFRACATVLADAWDAWQQVRP